jgi:hypothetical protein
MAFKQLTLCMVFICWQSSSLADTLAKPAIKALDPPSRVLFVGNSFSFYNNGIHNHYSALLRAANKWQTGKSYARLNTISGGALSEHVVSVPHLLQAADKPYDAVVLQGHSTEPVSKNKKAAFIQGVQQLDASIKQAKAQTILFMTWGYEGEAAMAQALAQAYIEAGNSIAALVVPVGLAFTQAQQQFPEINLYVKDVLGLNQQGQLTYRKDIKHPSSAGTYLAACVFYASLQQASPLGLAFHADLDPQTAAKLQKLAWQVSQAFYQ